MTDLEKRIRLAEAMGWTHIAMKWVAMDERSYPFGCPPADQYASNLVDKRRKVQIPDPFTDANDDYAVLEWMRKCNLIDGSPTRIGARPYLGFQQDYKVGDYARAALKVLDND